MLTLRNISVSVGNRQILDDVSFSLRPHRLTALVGRNGSGKSTLLACVNQQLPYTGQIWEGERNLALLSPKERAKIVAILPQFLSAPHITGAQMTAFGRTPYLDITGHMTQKDHFAVEQALAEANASALEGRYVDTLSGGERQRVALAMILAAVLFWDETILGRAVAVAAAVTAILSVWSLLGGKKPLAHAMADIPTVLFFILCLLCSYRTWSAEPEIQRYCYRLLALVCLMMAAYQRSAVWLGMGKGSLFLGTGILGVYFAFAAGADPGFTVLFLTLGVWMFAQLGAVTEKEPTDSDNKEAQSVEIQEERE